MNIKAKPGLKEHNPLFNMDLKTFKDTKKSFRFMCSDDNISILHFEQIFEVNEKYFHIWNKNKQNYIDSYEIFSAIILLSQIPNSMKLLSNKRK